MVRFKSSNVDFEVLTPALLHILTALVRADIFFPEDIIITSVNDSKHLPNSAHYRNEAVDIRCNDRPREVDEKLVLFLQKTLGPKFLVQIESTGTPNEHIHIQLRKGATWTLSF